MSLIHPQQSIIQKQESQGKAQSCFSILNVSSLSLILLSFVAFSFIALQPSRALAIGEYSSEYFSEIEQPIAFSHSTHVELNKMTCENCHTMARRSKNAGTPSVSTCIGCHISIKGTTEAQKTEIAKIDMYWKEQKPIPWKKIHDVPDFVYFSHKAHSNVGFDCTNCHGDVGKTIMPVPHAFNAEVPLTMGWCVTCHRTDWPVDSNNKIAQPIRKTRGGEIIADANPIVGHLNGPQDCTTCHQ